MGALKEFYHDQICQKEREATDYDYDYEQYLKTLKPSIKTEITIIIDNQNPEPKTDYANR